MEGWSVSVFHALDYLASHDRMAVVYWARLHKPNSTGTVQILKCVKVIGNMGRLPFQCLGLFGQPQTHGCHAVSTIANTDFA